MIAVPSFLKRLRDDREGAMVIETAIVAPLLVLMSLGAFQISAIIARQSELQSAAAEGAAIALASAPDTIAKRVTLKNVLVASTGLAADKVTVTQVFRCGNTTTYSTNGTNCGSGEVISSYVRIQLTDTYTPAWTEFGVGSPLNFNVVRYVQYMQQDPL